jgi:hypothetical protein
MLLDLRVFKIAKIAVKDLPEADKKFADAIALLTPYRKYKAVSDAIYELNRQKYILGRQLEVAKKTLNNKGQVG